MRTTVTVWGKTLPGAIDPAQPVKEAVTVSISLTGEEDDLDALVQHARDWLDHAFGLGLEWRDEVWA